LARAGRMYRVPQAGPRQPAVAGPVVQRWVRQHRHAICPLGHSVELPFAAGRLLSRPDELALS
jgi:hypothetical protein